MKISDYEISPVGSAALTKERPTKMNHLQQLSVASYPVLISHQSSQDFFAIPPNTLNIRITINSDGSYPQHQYLMAYKDKPYLNHINALP